jgi:hypothetical protein
MGAEARCVVRHEGQSSEGKAQLESETLIFRGTFRLKIPFQQIIRADVHQDSLRIQTAQGTVLFALGKTASQKWLQNILNPRTALDKLGIRAGMSIAVLGVDDAVFLKQLQSRVGSFERKLAGRRDCILWGIKDKKELAKLPALETALERTGGIWAIWPKGKPELKEDDIRNAAIAAGLVDVKVMKFSETHSGLRLVIPKARR